MKIYTFVLAMFLFQQIKAQYTDSLSLEAEILNYIPIGWGTFYRCELKEVIDGEIPDIDSVFTMSASVGSEDIFEDIHSMSIGEVYLMIFVKTDKTTDKSYIPAGTTGLIDNTGNIWVIVYFEKKE